MPMPKAILKYQLVIQLSIHGKLITVSNKLIYSTYVQHSKQKQY